VQVSNGRWLGGITVRTLDLWSKGSEFYSRLGRYQVVVTTRRGKPSCYI